MTGSNGVALIVPEKVFWFFIYGFPKRYRWLIVSQRVPISSINFNIFVINIFTTFTTSARFIVFSFLRSVDFWNSPLSYFETFFFQFNYGSNSFPFNFTIDRIHALLNIAHVYRTNSQADADWMAMGHVFDFIYSSSMRELRESGIQRNRNSKTSVIYQK